jgi:glyoxylase-like metal-dependent hydrolase (beta-lactamase superfamily II)
MATVHILQSGYNADRTAPSISLVRDGDARIVVDPGTMVDHGRMLDPLVALGVRPEEVTHVFLSHHHPDHTINAGLFTNAEIFDSDSRYLGDRWLDHPGDGYQLSPNTEIWQVPGHTPQDAALIVHAEDGVYALTHLWWHTDRTPEVDPYAPDQELLEANRARVLAVADIVIPGHGAPFRVEREVG